MGLRGNNHDDGRKGKWKTFGFAVLSILLIVFSLNFFFNKKPEQIITNKSLLEGEVVDGIHIRTGLIDDEGLKVVVTNCTACHSAQLIIQNRMNKERWNATIRWMQETQNLWELGDKQEVIVDYLVKNYPVKETGRREKLENIDWYELEE